MSVVMRRIALTVVALLALGALPVAACAQGARITFQRTNDNYEITPTRGLGWFRRTQDRATVVDAASFRAKEYEQRDTTVPGFLLKVTPAGRKIFMLQYRTDAGERRKPAIGRFGEPTVEQLPCQSRYCRPGGGRHFAATCPRSGTNDVMLQRWECR